MSIDLTEALKREGYTFSHSILINPNVDSDWPADITQHTDSLRLSVLDGTIRDFAILPTDLASGFHSESIAAAGAHEYVIYTKS